MLWISLSLHFQVLSYETPVVVKGWHSGGHRSVWFSYLPRTYSILSWKQDGLTVLSVTLTWQGTSVLWLGEALLCAPGPYTTSAQATLGPGVSTWAPLCICYPVHYTLPRFAACSVRKANNFVHFEYRRKMPTKNKEKTNKFRLWRLAFTRTHIPENVLELCLTLYNKVGTIIRLCETTGIWKSIPRQHKSPAFT